MKKITLKILGMDCAPCAMSIDGALEDTNGVKTSKTNFAKSHTEVEFDPELLNESSIIHIIKKVGYGVDTPQNK